MTDRGRDKRLRDVRPEDPLQDDVTWEGSEHQERPGDRVSASL